MEKQVETDINKGDVLTLKPKYGYWDVTKYPRGGSFHRFRDGDTCVVTEILDRYSDGEPKTVAADMGDRRIQFCTDAIV